MRIKSTKFKDLKIISSPVHKDNRGYFREVFKKKFFSKKKFVFTCISSSKKNVLRGMHFQKNFAQGKYLSVLKGEIFDVALDLRKNPRLSVSIFLLIYLIKMDFLFLFQKVLHMDSWVLKRKYYQLPLH